MKKSKLDAVLRRKVRIKITRRKRGAFEVVFPHHLTYDKAPFSKRCPSKRLALVYLFTVLRCLEPITIEVRRAT